MSEAWANEALSAVGAETGGVHGRLCSVARGDADRHNFHSAVTLRRLQAQVYVQSVFWTATTAEQRGAAILSVELTQQGNGVCHFVV